MHGTTLMLIKNNPNLHKMKIKFNKTQIQVKNCFNPKFFTRNVQNTLNYYSRENYTTRMDFHLQKKTH